MCRPQGDEYSYDDYSEDNYYDTPDNYDYGDNYGDLLSSSNEDQYHYNIGHDSVPA